MIKIDDVIWQTLKNKFANHHNLYPNIRPEGKYLESIIIDSLQNSDLYFKRLNWDPSSHRKGSDFDIHFQEKIVTCSVKSGKWILNNDKFYLRFSGYRLTRFNKNLNRINEFLISDRSDITISMPEAGIKTSNGVLPGFNLITIPAAIFIYPTDASQWISKVSQNRNRISEHIWQAENGLRVRICPSMSYQVWWDVPRELCNIHGFIPRSHEKSNTTLETEAEPCDKDWKILERSLHSV